MSNNISGYLPLSVNIISDSFFGQSRLDFEGDFDALRVPSEEGEVKADSQKKGIRFHTAITAFFLRLFGKIVDIRDCWGHVYHLNRGSVTQWIKAHDGDAIRLEDSFLKKYDLAINALLNAIGQSCPSKKVIRFPKIAYSDVNSINVADFAEMRNELLALERMKNLTDYDDKRKTYLKNQIDGILNLNK